MQIQLEFDSKLKLEYFGYLFPKMPGTDVHIVSCTHPVGEILVANVSISERPVADIQGELVAKLELPLNPASKRLINKFIYYSRGSMVAIMSAIGAVFDIDFAGYYRKGYNLGYRRKDIVEAFIISRGLVLVDNSDTLYKRVYRADQARMKALTKALLRRCYYLDESINLKGLKNETNNQGLAGEIIQCTRGTISRKAGDGTGIGHNGDEQN